MGNCWSMILAFTRLIFVDIDTGHVEAMPRACIACGAGVGGSSTAIAGALCLGRGARTVASATRFWNKGKRSRLGGVEVHGVGAGRSANNVGVSGCRLKVLVTAELGGEEVHKVSRQAWTALEKPWNGEDGKRHLRKPQRIWGNLYQKAPRQAWTALVQPREPCEKEKMANITLGSH